MSATAAKRIGSANRRKKSCPFSHKKAQPIDWKNVDMLKRFISDTGRIIPTRITVVSRKKQRELGKAIKRARYMSLIPNPDQK